MIKSRWTHRVIWIMNSILIGMALDRYFSTPLYTIGMALIILILGLVRLEYPSILEKRLKIDNNTAGIIRATVLAIIFFLLCALVALSI